MANENQKSEPSQETFKEQLDQAAVDQNQARREGSNPIVEKIAEIAPAVTKVLGVGSNQSESESKPDESETSGPPYRPDHDVHIEEFVRDQHRSKTRDGSLNHGS